MRTKLPSLSADPLAISRREAIRRATLILGTTLSPSLLAGVARAASASAPSGAKPAYLTAAEFATAGAVAERILPRTETPGALDVGVPAFIDLMYGEFMPGEEQRSLVAGLAGLESASESGHRRKFPQLTSAQQDTLLKSIAEGNSASAKAFLRQIRELTIVGYFTSETVGTTVLHYLPVPGRFDPCVPISEVGNINWTT